MADKSGLLDGIDFKLNYNMSKILNFIVISLLYTKLVNFTYITTAKTV